MNLDKETYGQIMKDTELTKEEAIQAAREIMDKMDEEAKKKFKRQFELEEIRKKHIKLSELFP